MTAVLRREAIDAQGILDRLYDRRWTATTLGEDSYVFDGPDGRRVIVSWDPDTEPGVPWLHASISYAAEWRMPGYSDMKQVAAAVFPNGHAYQAFVPPAQHINIRDNVLHLWGRADGVAVLPDFGREGTI